VLHIDGDTDKFNEILLLVN